MGRLLVIKYINESIYHCTCVIYKSGAKQRGLIVSESCARSGNRSRDLSFPCRPNPIFPAKTVNSPSLLFPRPPLVPPRLLTYAQNDVAQAAQLLTKRDKMLERMWVPRTPTTYATAISDTPPHHPEHTCLLRSSNSAHDDRRRRRHHG